jgi:hypothetical protein
MVPGKRLGTFIVMWPPLNPSMSATVIDRNAGNGKVFSFYREYFRRARKPTRSFHADNELDQTSISQYDFPFRPQLVRSCRLKRIGACVRFRQSLASLERRTPSARDLERDGPGVVPDRRALPIAGGDPDEKAITTALLDEFGFDAVDAGPLSEAGASIAGCSFTARG